MSATPCDTTSFFIQDLLVGNPIVTTTTLQIAYDGSPAGAKTITTTGAPADGVRILGAGTTNPIFAVDQALVVGPNGVLVGDGPSPTPVTNAFSITSANGVIQSTANTDAEMPLNSIAVTKAPNNVTRTLGVTAMIGNTAISTGIPSNLPGFAYRFHVEALGYHAPSGATFALDYISSARAGIVTTPLFQASGTVPGVTINIVANVGNIYEIVINNTAVTPIVFNVVLTVQEIYAV